MARNRPRRPGEDVVSFAVETGRILASSADDYRGRLTRGEITEQTVEALYPALGYKSPDAIQAARPVSITSRHPARSGNAYAASPVADRIQASNPNEFRAASPVKGAPKLFGANNDRDLPIIMASGLDPAILMEVPWQVRHRIAAEPDRGKVYRLLENYADDPVQAEYEFGTHSGADIKQQDPADAAARAANVAYEQACYRWAVGTPEAPRTITDNEYRELFSED